MFVHFVIHGILWLYENNNNSVLKTVTFEHFNAFNLNVICVFVRAFVCLYISSRYYDVEYAAMSATKYGLHL